MSYITRSLASQTGATYTVATLAALKALTTRPEVVIVETGQAKGVWQWEAGSSTTADDGTVVECTSGTAGRYKRIYDGAMDARWFGAVADWNGTTGTNIKTAVDAAIAAGATTVILPANSIYKVTGNILPDDVHFIGESWFTSIVSSNDRTTDTLSMGARSSLRNVGIISDFGDDEVQPAGTDKICPVGWLLNSSDSSRAITNWVGQAFSLYSGPQITGPNGVVSTDIPLASLVSYAPGADCLYIDSKANLTSAIRMVSSGSGAIGMFLLNGWQLTSESTSADNHTGIWLKDYNDGTNTIQYGARFTRIGNGTLMRMENNNASSVANQSAAFMDWVVTNQATGNLFNIFQSTTAFSGRFLYMNAGQSGGTFTGDFERFDNAGVQKWRVDANGAATAASTFTSTIGTITASTPAFDATQTWNNSGVDFIGIKFNATNTNSGGSSTLLQLLVGGTDMFRVYKSGFVYAASQYNVAAGGSFSTANRGNMAFTADGTIRFSNNAGSDAATVQAANFASNNAAAILASRATITGGGTGNAPTLTAGPVAGNPTKWLPYDDNGTTRYIPSW